MCCCYYSCFARPCPASFKIFFENFFTAVSAMQFPPHRAVPGASGAASPLPPPCPATFPAHDFLARFLSLMLYCRQKGNISVTF